ncbi:retrovirus-related Pol polyprotein from transposon 17.6 [Trichonephila clavipes]|nr:retrovirus-related Pol polyprotein from transposon 17.6 [Trichonephila clavipes]
MQNMMELNFLVGKKKFITVLDMLKGYWSIPMEDSSKRLTAFRNHRGQYQWNVLPFGLRNAAATYQRAMSKVVQTISDFACAYIDDLAIFSDTWEEHLEEVFKRLEHFNFSVNLGKCEFARQKVKYLGHVIGSGRHSPDKERIKAIQNLQALTTKKLRSALGLCNFYRQYIPNFAKIALPLTELTKKKVPNEIPWSKEAENAFKEFKTAITMWNYRVVGPRHRETVLLAYGSFSDCGRMLSRSIGWRRQHSSHSFWEPETEPKPTKLVNN